MKKTIILLGIGKHTVKGSPVKSILQAQIGLWLTILQIVLTPQVPIQGSTHFLFLHARFREHSELNTHSGLQPGGLPTYSGRQEQTAWLFITRHWLLGPQGEGLHGSLATITKMISSY